MTDKKTLPTFEIQARPLCVPPELVAMAPTTMIKVIGALGGGNGYTTKTAADYVQELQATIARQAKGYFTVEEAAQVLADSNPGEVEAKPIVQQMIHDFHSVDAFQKPKLLIRNTGDKFPPLNKNEVRPYIHLVRAGEVNKWLQDDGHDYRLPETPARVVTDQAGDEGTQDPERRLAALRALGGTVKYQNCGWKFTGITKLVESEKGRPRSDVKTIRSDLKEAAQAERDAKSAVYVSGLGQR